MRQLKLGLLVLGGVLLVLLMLRPAEQALRLSNSSWDAHMMNVVNNGEKSVLGNTLEGANLLSDIHADFNFMAGGRYSALLTVKVTAGERKALFKLPLSGLWQLDGDQMTLNNEFVGDVSSPAEQDHEIVVALRYRPFIRDYFNQAYTIVVSDDRHIVLKSNNSALMVLNKASK